MRQNFTVLTKRLLDRELEVANHKLRTKSDSTPTAQTPKLLSAGNSPGQLDSTLESAMPVIKKQNIVLWHLINFMSASACRVSEVLAIKVTDITSGGLVKIHAKKGSMNRIVSAGMATDFLKEYKKRGFVPWAEWSRFYVYREFKKYGIAVHKAGEKHAKITHAIRHTVVQSMKEAGMSKGDSQNALGHKSIKSTEHYYGKH